MGSKILIIDDNEEIQQANFEYLTNHGFSVTTANTGIKALSYLNDQQFDCIVLDILLPDLDGFTICKAARTITQTPILFLSCLDEADDKVKGLMSGADDYMTKPYSLKELAARIHTLMRRRNPPQQLSGVCYIDRVNRIVQVGGKTALLSDKEFRMFELFYGNPETVFSKQQLLDAVWYGNAEIGVVAVLVLKLRRKIEFAENVIGSIETSYGSGYYLSSPDKEVES